MSTYIDINMKQKKGIGPVHFRAFYDWKLFDFDSDKKKSEKGGKKKKKRKKKGEFCLLFLWFVYDVLRRVLLVEGRQRRFDRIYFSLFSLFSLSLFCRAPECSNWSSETRRPRGVPPLLTRMSSVVRSFLFPFLFFFSLILFFWVWFFGDNRPSGKWNFSACHLPALPPCRPAPVAARCDWNVDCHPFCSPVGDGREITRSIENHRPSPRHESAGPIQRLDATAISGPLSQLDRE